MATNVHSRDLILQADTPRVEAVTLPSNVTYNGDTSGNHLGTLSGSAQTNFQNSQITLSSTGALQNAGGGSLTSLNNVGGNYLGTLNSLGLTVHRNDQITLSSGGALLNAGGGAITNLDYSNVSGTKPPASATANFFSTSGSNPSGGSDGDAHWNSSSLTMWFKTSGVWRVGGTVNANEIITGTLAAARIASNSVTTDKLNVGGALSNITSNLGTVSSGTLTSSVSMSVNGSAVFNGSSDQGFGAAAVNANIGLGSTNGVVGRASFGNGVLGRSSTGNGVLGQATSAGGVGGQFSGSGGADALQAFGSILLQGGITISTQTISNLTAGNSNSLGNVGASSWGRAFNTDTGVSNAVGFGWGLNSTVASVRVRASGNNMIIENFSDSSLKTDIESNKSGLSFVNSLRPVTYKDIYHPEIPRHGFLADEVINVRGGDGYVRTLEDGMLSFDQNELIGALVNCVKELKEEIDELKKKILI